MPYVATGEMGRCRRFFPPTLLSLLLVTGSLVAPARAGTDEMRHIVESGELARQPNPVVLEFLRHEGSEVLETELRDRAVAQMVEALRDRTLVDPLAQLGEAMRGPMQGFKPSNMLRQMVGAGGPGGGSLQMQGMQQKIESALVDPWVRGLQAASILVLAGDTEAPAKFYRGCLTSIGSMMPLGSRNDWLQDRCIEGALEMGPEEAGALFADIYDEPYVNIGIDWSMFAGQGGGPQPMPQIQAVAAKALGKLVGTGALSGAQRRGVMQAIVGMAEVKKQDEVALEGAIQGLSYARDPVAVDPLRELWKKGKPKEIRPVALTGLVAGYRQPDAIEALRKDLSGGGVGRALAKAKSFAPWTQENPGAPSKQAEKADDRYEAATALIQADDAAGYEWSSNYLDRRNLPEGQTDRRPDVVRDLVESGGPRAHDVLAERVADGHENEWLEAWMQIGLFELGDESQLPELRELATKSDWDFGRGTAAQWYKRLKPLIWEAIKMAAGVPPDKDRLRRMVADFAFAERDRALGRKSERERRTAQFRWQLADALGEFDDPRALPILGTFLEDDDRAVRLSAARALLGQSSPGAASLLARAVELDYGEEEGVSRNPEIRAALLRHLVSDFDDADEARRAAAAARRSEAPSLRFFGLAAEELLTRRTTRAAASSR